MTEITDLLEPIRKRSEIAAKADSDYYRSGYAADYVRALEPSAEDVPLLLGALDKVLALHYEDLFRGHLSNGCKTCGGDYPCPTVRAVATALGEQA
jgi:hypothetical protein